MANPKKIKLSVSQGVKAEFTKAVKAAKNVDYVDINISPLMLNGVAMKYTNGKGEQSLSALVRVRTSTKDIEELEFTLRESKSAKDGEMYQFYTTSNSIGSADVVVIES